jgi:uncharacterized Zn finger protein
MRTVKDYASGKILDDVQRTEQKIKTLSETGDPTLKQELEESSKDSTNKHYMATMKELKKLLDSAETIAIGSRICQTIHEDCEHPSESVFLDELAEALIDVGKAKKATKDEAYTVLKEGKEKGHPHVVSIVEGKPMELCNTCTDCCVLWQREKIGIPSIKK